MKALLFSFLFALLIRPAAAQQTPFRTLTPAQMTGDLNLLYGAWTQLHPGLYRFRTPAEMSALFAQARSECRAPLDERRFYLILSQLARQVHCGHTYLNPLNQPEATRERLLPERVVPFFFTVGAERSILITHNLSGIGAIQKGDEIESINGIPARQIIDSLLTVSRSDGRHAEGKKLSNISETPDEGGAYSLFDIYLPLFFPAPGGQYTFTIKPFAGRQSRHTYKVDFLSLQERADAYTRRFGALPEGERSWQYRLLNPQTAYMKFGTFAFWNSSFDEKAFVDSAFRDVRHHPGVRNLVIDIRDNEGGDNTGDYILSYITDRKIGCDDPDHACYRYLRIPDTLQPHLSTWDKTFRQPKDSTGFFRNALGLYERKEAPDSCAYIVPQPEPFRGRVFLLTNAKNSSAGYEMARNFRTAKLGTIVGEATGGCQQGINGGEFFFLTLPASQMEIDLPLIFNYHPNKPDAGIVPDYPVPVAQRDIAQGRDGQLDFVQRMIARGRR